MAHFVLLVTPCLVCTLMVLRAVDPRISFIRNARIPGFHKSEDWGKMQLGIVSLISRDPSVIDLRMTDEGGALGRHPTGHSLEAYISGK